MLIVIRGKINFLVIYVYLRQFLDEINKKKIDKCRKISFNRCFFIWHQHVNKRMFLLKGGTGFYQLGTKFKGLEYNKAKELRWGANLNLQLLVKFKKKYIKKYFIRGGGGRFKRRRLNTFNFIRYYYFALGQKRGKSFRRKKMLSFLISLRKENFYLKKKSQRKFFLNFKSLMGGNVVQKRGIQKINEKSKGSLFLEKKSFKQKKFKKWKIYRASPNDLKYWAVSNKRGSRIGDRRKLIYRIILNTCFLKFKMPYLRRFNFSSLVVKPKFYFMLKRRLNNYFFTLVDRGGNVKFCVSAGNLGISAKKKKRPLYVTKELVEWSGRRLLQLGIKEIESVLFFFFNKRLTYDVFFILKRFGIRIKKFKVVTPRPHGKLPRLKKLRRL